MSETNSNNEHCPEPKYLQSEIINQKKKLIFKVEQTIDHAFPNEDFKYYIYIKNISGVKVENVRVKVNNPSEILINTKYDNEEDGYIEIGDLDADGKDSLRFIYLKANCQATGKHYVHFICHGNGTGLYYKSLMLRCSYTHSSDNLIHRLHIYDFTPYEDTYFMKIKDFNSQATQLFKTQKLPFKAGEQPFHMTARDDESTVKPFSNIEQESFLDQNTLLKNTKEHVYQYITRENFNENSVENYEGENLIDLVNQVNKHSKLFRAKFLKTGTNELRTNLQEYEPNGFIHRFGLLNSEIYHYLGTLPSYSYMSDYLFRWAPDGKEPLNLYPEKIAMKWNTKVWAGRGWIVYRVLTKEYLDYLNQNSSDSTHLMRWLNKKESRWKIVGHFMDEMSAQSYIDRQLYIDSNETARTQRGFAKYEYYMKESYYDSGVFFIHIPINKIPSNFYLLDTENLEGLIQRAKPFGAKALIRYMIESEFDNHMEFTHYPIYKPYTEIDMSDTSYISYFIQSQKYKLINSKECIITVTVGDNATGNIILNVNNKEFTIPIKNGNGILNCGELINGKNTIKATYNGDNEYNSGSNSIDYYFPLSTKKLPNLNINIENNKITVNVGENATGNVIIRINNDESTVPIINNIATLNNAALIDGNNNITVKYSGNEEYTSGFNSIVYKKSATKNRPALTISINHLQHYGLTPHGLTSICNFPFEAEMITEKTKMLPTIYMADKKQELIQKNLKLCSANDTNCKNYMENIRPYPDNSLNHNIEHNIVLKSTYIDNDLSRLNGVANLLYLNNFDNISFSILKTGFKPYKTNNQDNRDSENSFIHNWIVKGNPSTSITLTNDKASLCTKLSKEYKAYSYKVERKANPGTDHYITTNQKKKINSFEIIITQKDFMKHEGGEIGIGFTDKLNKNHMFSIEHNDAYPDEDYLKYTTMYNNNFKLKKDGYANVNSLVIKLMQIKGDYNNTMVIFFAEVDRKLQYFHHIICPNLTEVFIFLSKNLAYEREYLYKTDGRGNRKLVYLDNKGNEITATCHDSKGDYLCYKSIYTDEETGKKKPGTPALEYKPIDLGSLLYYNYSTTEKVTFNTPSINEIDKYETTIYDGGENWKNLYRINKAENSYTYIQNGTNEPQEVDDIFIHFDNIEIPERAIIKSLKLKTITESSHAKSIYASSSYQNSHIFEDVLGNTIKLQSDNRECYHQTCEGQAYYYMQIEKTNNKRKIDYFTNLINENIIFDESVDFDNGIILNNPFWIETSQFTDIPYDCNNVKNIELVIEGFNHGPNVNLIPQLLYEENCASAIAKKINNGYFFKKISLPFSTSFLLDWTRLRFRFEDLNHDIEIFDYYLNVTFINKETKYNIEITETDEITSKNKQITYMDLLQDNTTAEELNNGLTIQLSFDDLFPGEYYRIYSNELEIEYTIQDTEFMLNKNQFFDDADTKFISITGDTKDTYLSGQFYTDANHFSQKYSDVGADNLGLELRDSVYQAFILPTDNITGIQIYPNGFKGSPDANLKLGIYENRGTTPGKLIKEVYASGWSKTNKSLKDLNNIKYEININDLKPFEIYWFKFEVENPTDNSYYLLKYTTTQRNECKLLMKENNNYINMSGSLQFDIYTKDLSYGFSQLPTMQDYLSNPYVKIGLHRGQGTIKNLVVKKSNNGINRVVTNGKF